MSRLALLVRCGGCGREFDTGIRMATRNFAKATLAANYHTCPHCGRRGTYHKSDYLTRDPEARTAGAREDSAPPGPQS